MTAPRRHRSGTTYRVRVLAASTAALALAGLAAGCSDDAAGDAESFPGILQVEDLPAEPGSTEEVKAPEDLTPACNITNEPFWNDSALESQVVAYDDVDGERIISAAYRLKSEDSDVDPEQQLRIFEQGWRECPAARGAGDGSELTEVDLAAGQFGYTSTDADGDVLGTQGLAVVDGITVQVSIYPEDGQEPQADLQELLDAAAVRASDAA